MKIKVKESQAGQRLDIVVHGKLPSISRSSVQQLCDSGRVMVNDKPGKAGLKLKPDDRIVVNYDPKESLAIPNIELPILYEDEDCIVINKPVGVLTHSKGALNPEATVATFIRDKIKDMTGDRAGIVHRLDRPTSGIIICAKHPEALSWLQKQFATRSVKKQYIAIVPGQLTPDKAKIDMPIGRNPHKPQTFRVISTGKPAVTTYETVKTSEKYSQILLKPETGRTHQLRVHLKQVGHPILGDVVYGILPADRLYLHSKSLEITLPSHKRRVFSAPLPPEFSRIMK